MDKYDRSLELDFQFYLYIVMTWLACVCMPFMHIIIFIKIMDAWLRMYTCLHIY